MNRQGWVVRAVAFVLASASSLSVAALDIASCSNPKGKAYYAEKGPVGPESSGWTDDYITGGLTKVKKIGENEYDLLYVDARKEIVSARQDGAHILVVHQSDDAFSLLVVYPGTTAEVYTFLKTSSGKLEYLHTLSRAGSGQGTTKASVMRGDCDYIKFDQMPAQASP